MCSISEISRLLSCKAFFIASLAPTPSSAGAVIWKASSLWPKPVTSAYIFADLFLAASSSSRIKTPAPSPRTNPSLSLSQGRLASSGESFLVDNALAALNPAIPRGDIAASAPPATITSASP